MDRKIGRKERQNMRLREYEKGRKVIDLV